MSADLASLAQWRGAAGRFGKEMCERWHVTYAQVNKVSQALPIDELPPMNSAPVAMMSVQSVENAAVRSEMAELRAVRVLDPLFCSATNDCAAGSFALLCANNPALFVGMQHNFVASVQKRWPGLCADGVRSLVRKIWKGMNGSSGISATVLEPLRALMSVACTALPLPVDHPLHVVPEDAAQVETPGTAVPIGAVAALLRACSVRATILVEYANGSVDRIDVGDAHAPFLGALLALKGHICAVVCDDVPAAPAPAVPVVPLAGPSDVAVVLPGGAHVCVPLDTQLNILQTLTYAVYRLGTAEQRFVLDGR